jgi:hypothetical protein
VRLALLFAARPNCLQGLAMDFSCHPVCMGRDVFPQHFWPRGRSAWHCCCLGHHGRLLDPFLGSASPDTLSSWSLVHGCSCFCLERLQTADFGVTSAAHDYWRNV